MADSSNQGMIMMVVMLALAAGVGYFFFIRKSSSSISGTTTPAQVNPAPSAASQSLFSMGTQPQYSSVQPQIDPNTGVPLNPYTIPGKAQLPIISGSVVSTDPYLFTPQSAGMCQCNDQTCCYYSPFYEAHSLEALPGPETRVCKTVSFGDQLSACNLAVSGFQTNYQQEVKASRARAMIAMDQRAHISARPAKAMLLNIRNRNRHRRMFGFL